MHYSIVNKIIATHGRLRLERSATSQWFCIVEKEKLADSFDIIPRNILHTGTETYINNIWKKYTKQEKYITEKV